MRQARELRSYELDALVSELSSLGWPSSWMAFGPMMEPAVVIQIPQHLAAARWYKVVNVTDFVCFRKGVQNIGATYNVYIEWADPKVEQDRRDDVARWLDEPDTYFRSYPPDESFEAPAGRGRSTLPRRIAFQLSKLLHEADKD